MAFDPTTMTAEDLAAAVAYTQKLESDKRESAKQATARKREFVATVLDLLVGTDIPQEEFTSGAKGYSLGGSKIGVTLPDGSTRAARVSMLIRWEDTIPAKDEK